MAVTKQEKQATLAMQQAQELAEKEAAFAKMLHRLIHNDPTLFFLDLDHSFFGNSKLEIVDLAAKCQKLLEAIKNNKYVCHLRIYVDDATYLKKSTINAMKALFLGICKLLTANTHSFIKLTIGCRTSGNSSYLDAADFKALTLAVEKNSKLLLLLVERVGAVLEWEVDLIVAIGRGLIANKTLLSFSSSVSDFSVKTFLGTKDLSKKVNAIFQEVLHTNRSLRVLNLYSHQFPIALYPHPDAPLLTLNRGKVKKNNLKDVQLLLAVARYDFSLVKRLHSTGVSVCSVLYAEPVGMYPTAEHPGMLTAGTYTPLMLAVRPRYVRELYLFNADVEIVNKEVMHKGQKICCGYFDVFLQRKNGSLTLYWPKTDSSALESESLPEKEVAEIISRFPQEPGAMSYKYDKALLRSIAAKYAAFKPVLAMVKWLLEHDVYPVVEAPYAENVIQYPCPYDHAQPAGLSESEFYHVDSGDFYSAKKIIDKDAGKNAWQIAQQYGFTEAAQLMAKAFGVSSAAVVDQKKLPSARDSSFNRRKGAELSSPPLYPDQPLTRQQPSPLVEQKMRPLLGFSSAQSGSSIDNSAALFSDFADPLGLKKPTTPPMPTTVIISRGSPAASSTATTVVTSAVGKKSPVELADDELPPPPPPSFSDDEPPPPPPSAPDTDSSALTELAAWTKAFPDSLAQLDKLRKQASNYENFSLLLAQVQAIAPEIDLLKKQQQRLDILLNQDPETQRQLTYIAENQKLREFYQTVRKLSYHFAAAHIINSGYVEQAEDGVDLVINAATALGRQIPGVGMVVTILQQGASFTNAVAKHQAMVRLATWVPDTSMGDRLAELFARQLTLSKVKELETPGSSLSKHPSKNLVERICGWGKAVYAGIDYVVSEAKQIHREIHEGHKYSAAERLALADTCKILDAILTGRLRPATGLTPEAQIKQHLQLMLELFSCAVQDSFVLPSSPAEPEFMPAAASDKHRPKSLPAPAESDTSMAIVLKRMAALEQERAAERAAYQELQLSLEAQKKLTQQLAQESRRHKEKLAKLQLAPDSAGMAGGDQMQAQLSPHLAGDAKANGQATVLVEHHQRLAQLEMHMSILLEGAVSPVTSPLTAADNSRRAELLDLPPADAVASPASRELVRSPAASDLHIFRELQRQLSPGKGRDGAVTPNPNPSPLK